MSSENIKVFEIQAMGDRCCERLFSRLRLSIGGGGSRREMKLWLSVRLGSNYSFKDRKIFERVSPRRICLMMDGKKKLTRKRERHCL